MRPHPRRTGLRGAPFLLLNSFLLCLFSRDIVSATPFVCGGIGRDSRFESTINGVAAKITGTAQERSSDALSALVIFCKFSDEAGGDTKPEWADDLFNPQRQGSFTHFYNEMSRGQLAVGGQVLDKRYSSLSPSSAYVADEPGTLGKFATFNLEILQQADLDVDMGLFDNDGPDRRPNSGDDDGYVDVVFINLLTVPRDFFIGGATGLASLGLERDFISDDAAAGGGQIRIRSHYSGFGGTTQRGHVFAVTAATMCHEFGHVLGLPDLFDQSTIGADSQFDPAEDSAGIGKWGLMGLGTLGWGVEDGPNAFSAWSLMKLGWVGVENAGLETIETSADNVIIEQIDRGGGVYRIPVTIDEYFLVENRQSSGSYYNRNIPAGGLLLWHVDERADNDEETHKQVDLVCADGLYESAGFPGNGDADPVAGRDNLDFWASDASYADVRNGNRGDATDPFDGIRFTSFDADSNPGARAHTGNTRNLKLNFALNDIRSLGDGRMSVDFEAGRQQAGQITTDTTWSGVLEIAGDVVIAPGATLTVESGTTVHFNRGDETSGGFDPLRAELIAFGGLVIRGTDDEPVTFESAASRPRSGDWGGILLLDGQSSELESEVDAGRVAVAHARFGLLRSRLPEGRTLWTGRRDIPWDTVVPSGAELVIDAGATVGFGASDFAVRGRSAQFVELTVEGALRVQGSETDPAILTVDATDLQAGWFGVVMEPGAVVAANHLVVERAAVGITGDVTPDGHLALTDCRFQICGRGLNVTIFDEVTVDRTAFDFITLNAVRAEGTGIVRLRNSTISSIGLDGISLGNCNLEAIGVRVAETGLLDPSRPASGLVATGGNMKSIELRNCTVNGTTLSGLRLDEWRGRVELHGCEIRGNSEHGISIDGAELVVLEDNLVEGNRAAGADIRNSSVKIWTTKFGDNLGPGLALTATSGFIEMNSFKSVAGVQLNDGADVIVRRNDFVSSSVALESISSSPTIDSNRFERNLTAIRVSGDAVPRSIAGNVFEDNGRAIQNLTSWTLEAPENYWGTADSAAIAAQLDGSVEWTPFLVEDPMAAVVSEVEGGDAPDSFSLGSGSPNPFNSQVRIDFDVPVREWVHIEIYDALGRRLRTLVSDELSPGRYDILWDGRDGENRRVASGLYIYRMTAGEFRQSGRMVLVRFDR